MLVPMITTSVPGCRDGRRRRRDVGVDVGDRDRGAGQQARPRRGALA